MTMISLQNLKRSLMKKKDSKPRFKIFMNKSSIILPKQGSHRKHRKNSKTQSMTFKVKL